MSDTEVTIGGKPYTIQKFRGLKAILVMASMTRIARDIPDLLADATKAYYERNTITITEAMSKLPRWEGFSTEDFDKAEAKTGKRVVELPAPITAREQVLTALPALLENARTEIIRLFAILVIPSGELMAADKANTVNTALDKYGDLFLYEAELDELVEVALAAQDSIAQLNPETQARLGEMLRSLTKSLGLNWGPQSTQAPQTPETTLTPPTSTDDAPTSLTDSPAPTDGQENRLSMASPGVS